MNIVTLEGSCEMQVKDQFFYQWLYISALEHVRKYYAVVVMFF